MRLRRQIRADSSVSSVGSSSAFCGLVNTDMLQSEILEILGDSIGFEILDESEHHFDRFFGPSSQSLAELFGLASSPDSSEVFFVGDTSLVGKHVIQILFGLCQGHSFHSIGGFVGVLIMNSELLS